MAPSVVSPMTAKQAERLKEDGNSCFKKERFGAAIDAYTEAITLSPNVPVYWTNRALCHMKRNDWTRVEEDCRRAIQLDHYSVKAHYMLGLALLQKKEYADGVKQLQRALDLGRGANPTGYMVNEIWEELAKAKYMEWELESARRSWELNSLKETCEAALNQQRAIDMSRTEESSQEAYSSHTEQLKALDRVFEKAAIDDKQTEIKGMMKKIMEIRTQHRLELRDCCVLHVSNAPFLYTCQSTFGRIELVGLVDALLVMSTTTAIKMYTKK